MTLSIPARLHLGLLSILFLIVFFIFSSFDLAVIICISAYFILTKTPFTTVFFLSLLLLVIDLFFQSYDIFFRLITDLSLDAYILFLTAVVLYLQSRKDVNEFINKSFSSDQNFYIRQKILKIGGSLVLALLLFPVFGGYLASLSGYIFYSYLNKQFNSKAAIIISLIFLGIAAVFLVFKKNLIAETLANYIYLFIVVGTVQEIIKVFRFKKTESTDHFEKIKPEEIIDIVPKMNTYPVWIIFALLLFSLVTYLFYPTISKYKFLRISVPKINFKIPSINFIKKRPALTLTPTPTITIIPAPSLTPTPIIKVSTLTASLKVKVLNGTEITGLAGSTSAKLKKVGFQNVEIDNADTTDNNNWKVTFKKQEEDIVNILKNILELDTLNATEASPEAKFDIEILAGEKK